MEVNMDWAALFETLKTFVPWIQYVLMGLGTLVVLGATYVKMTPSTDDDALWIRLENTPVLGPLLKTLAAFSPITRK